MRKIFFFLLASLVYTSTFAQLYDPVSYRTRVKHLDGDQYLLTITATIGEGWHLYSQNVPEGGPIPTAFSFTEHKNYRLSGNTTEPEGHEIDDPVFEMRIRYFEDEAVFKQKVIRKSKSAFAIAATVEYMVCNEESCLPPTVKELHFEITEITETTAVPAPVSSKSTAQPSETGAQQKIKDTAVTTTLADTTHSSGASDSYMVRDEGVADTRKSPENQGISTLSKENTETSSADREGTGWVRIFLLNFLGGLAALLTPCVFPMIPMTVSFFTKQSRNRKQGMVNALWYGVSIIAIYVCLGSVVTAIFGASALNALATNVIFNVVFFLLLLFFAFSFLGAFELVLPGSWLNRIDRRSQAGGVIGILFMALALAVVSFSCTGPIVGTLLVQAASKGGWMPVIGMFGFALALALPFTLFAMFPGWMNALPKSGGWLNSVKVVLGFLELAFAFKFLSNADLVLQLHLLERETFLAIWIAIFGMLTLYLLGKIKLPHDSSTDRIGVGRLGLAILSLAFTVYMIPGLWGAPLQWISGFPPSQEYSESPGGPGMSSVTRGTGEKSIPEGGEEGPLGIPAFRDYNTGLTYAREVNKPVLLDFTGFACVNCRKMEQRVWPDPAILDILKNEVVLVSLYVDDRRPLPEPVSEEDRKYSYTGQKWSALQIEKFGANAQPYYVLLDHEEEPLQDPEAYNPDINAYHTWLRRGIEKFKIKSR